MKAMLVGFGGVESNVRVSPRRVPESDSDIASGIFRDGTEPDSDDRSGVYVTLCSGLAAYSARVTATKPPLSTSDEDIR